MRKISSALFLIPLSTLCLTSPVQARLNTITGGVTMGYDYDETNYDRDDIEDSLLDRNTSQQQVSIGPLFIFETTSSVDSLTFSYNPSFVYDFDDSQSDVDHDLSLSAYRDISRQWRVELSERFVFSDDPELLGAETSSDYNRGRRRYWTNELNANSSYTYDVGSTFGAGYTYRILRNDDTGIGGYEDYDRHIADLSLAHRINGEWNFSLFTNYTRGLFDPPEQETVTRTEIILEDLSPGITDRIDTEDLSNDLSEYGAGGTLNWIYSTRKTFFVSYDYSASFYDASLHNDTKLHNLSFGAQYQHTRRLSFDFGGGPTYEKTETFDANWDYNAHLNLSYDIAEHSAISAGIEKGFAQENFSSNNNLLGRDRGLTEFWNYTLDFTHTLTADLTTTLYGSYRDENQENILLGIVNDIQAENNLASADREAFREESIFTRKIYEVGGSLSYTFLQWYTAALNYTYRKQDSELAHDSYDEHRVFLTLSFQKELFRW
ncbi:MAG TPA: hypothetical protein EYP35_10080 [Desulfobacterales bacterium]|nr:hypothetical protein [Desulfobacterales bacterium]HIP37909.1 hypothetical protein [Desulfocapsa sulfexigens]